MAVINVTSGSQAILTLGNSSTIAQPGNAAGFVIPLVQDITVNTTPGTVRYSTLDSTASSAFTTVMENSVSLNMLVDEAAFFGDSGVSNNTVRTAGIWSTSNTKTEVFFSVAFEGDTGGDYYMSGKGFIGGLAPTASIEQAVWISPMEIIVNGDITTTTV
tara:strand:+ start:6238 stop:6717 length:480 start_codon:yes stop_codon:yes gene_type:complete